MWCKTKTGGTGSAHRFRAGVKKLLENVRDQKAVVLLVCDQPFVTICTINGLITVREKTNKSIVASTYADTLGVPALFAHCFFRNCFHSAMKPARNRSFCENASALRNLVFPKVISTSIHSTITRNCLKDSARASELRTANSQARRSRYIIFRRKVGGMI